jgi:ABC-type polysaccharide/polyol phosphate transport system ATPase subunit
MLPEGTIVVDRVWKRFRADRRRRQLREELERVINRFRGNDRGWRWALRDISLELEPGASLGLFGINGSGKTTILRMMAGVMYPYAGRVELSGKIGALIDLKAGLHPDLSGKENVYITGALLGFRRKEIARRFDEIVAFAELEDAITRQVKFFSSGMQLRLGFAIAAFMDPDILLVDEVLGVGDAAFQQKCLDRTRDMIASGATLVFVSHHLESIEGLCRQGAWLDGGVIQSIGPIREVLGSYRRSIEENEAKAGAQARNSGPARLVKTEIVGPQGNGCRTGEPLEIRTIIETDEVRKGDMYIGISEGPGTPIFVLTQNVSLSPGETETRCRISEVPLPRGRFYAWMGIVDGSGQEILRWQPAAPFDVAGPDLSPTPQGIVRVAPVMVKAAWEVERR